MQLLERVVYLLTTARAAAALDPLLSILIRQGWKAAHQQPDVWLAATRTTLPSCGAKLHTEQAALMVVPPCIACCRCCQAGKDIADMVMDTPGMVAALKTVLDAPPPPVHGAPVAEGAAGAYGVPKAGEWSCTKCLCCTRAPA
jgi:hypothetical protein